MRAISYFLIFCACYPSAGKTVEQYTRQRKVSTARNGKKTPRMAQSTFH